MTRYQGQPGWVKALLTAGEHPHVDYKQVLPKQTDFAKALCAAANAVAVRRDLEEFVFLVGVKEVPGTGGLVSGKVTGLLDPASGQVRDIEAEKLAVVNAAREVEPSPHVEIDECGAGTAKPFLAVRVRSTDAPHRLGDRYVVRMGSHTVPLEAHLLRQIFVDARTQAFIEELDDENHFTRTLRMILSEVAGLSHDVSSVEFAVADEAAERRRSAQALEGLIEHTYERLRDGTAASEDLSDLAGDLDAAHASVNGLYEELGGATERLSHIASSLRVPTVETARWEVARARIMNWGMLCSWRRAGDVTDEIWGAVSALFSAFFFDDVASLGPDSLLAEHYGWLERSAKRTGSVDLILHRACTAAVEAALHGRSGPPWMQAELEGFGFGDHSWFIELANREHVAAPASNPMWRDESALLVCSPDRIRSHVEALGAVPFDLADDVLVFRLSDCRIEMRLAEVSPLLLIPNPTDDRFPESIDFLRQLRRRLRRTELEVVRCSPLSGGQLAPLAGERPPKPERRGLDRLLPPGVTDATSTR